ncbi:hypothetical protein LUCX_26 [Xanthomonas phage vB_XciM_LucasX]|nr:hypothetical protein LUCX_26 [Xanthomonas phage vB_XciM_LucasX]
MTAQFIVSTVLTINGIKQPAKYLDMLAKHIQKHLPAGGSMDCDGAVVAHHWPASAANVKQLETIFAEISKGGLAHHLAYSMTYDADPRAILTISTFVRDTHANKFAVLYALVRWDGTIEYSYQVNVDPEVGIDESDVVFAENVTVPAAQVVAYFGLSTDPSNLH